MKLLKVHVLVCNNWVHFVSITRDPLGACNERAALNEGLFLVLNNQMGLILLEHIRCDMAHFAVSSFFLR